MQVVIYVDAVFIINFTVDLFVIWVTSVFFHQRVKPWRLLLSAFIGSGILLLYIYAPSLCSGASGILLTTGISMGAIAISFGGMGLIKKWFLSTTIMFLLGGIMYFFRTVMGWRILTLYKWCIMFGVGGIACSYLIHFLKENGRRAASLYYIRIIKNGKTVPFKAFLDTGNMLYDSLYQKPVILLSENTARKCLTEEEQALADEIMNGTDFDYNSILKCNAQRNTGFHRIRYKSVGRENGWLVCFLADEVWVDEKACLYRQPIAIAPPFLFEDKEYQGLLHRECI